MLTYCLLLTNSTKDERAYENVAQICLRLGALDVFISVRRSGKSQSGKHGGPFWKLSSTTTEMDECDVVCPRTELRNL